MQQFSLVSSRKPLESLRANELVKSDKNDKNAHFFTIFGTASKSAWSKENEDFGLETGNLAKMMIFSKDTEWAKIGSLSPFSTVRLWTASNYGFQTKNFWRANLSTQAQNTQDGTPSSLTPRNSRSAMLCNRTPLSACSRSYEQKSVLGFSVGKLSYPFEKCALFWKFVTKSTDQVSTPVTDGLPANQVRFINGTLRTGRRCPSFVFSV